MLLISVIFITSFLSIVNADAAKSKIKTHATESKGTEITSLDDIAPGQDPLGASQLSDEKIRRLVLAELDQSGRDRAAIQPEQGGLTYQLRHWLHSLDSRDTTHSGIGTLVAAYFQLPGDLVKPIGSIGNGKVGALIGYLELIVGVFLTGAGAERYCRFIIAKAIEAILAADCVVSMGGYNTICEIVSTTRPSLIIPRSTPREEQLIRARIFAKTGLLEYIP